ncbi:MAG: hypothetical protein ACXW3L_02625 [Limisphaerales bacterium]
MGPSASVNMIVCCIKGKSKESGPPHAGTLVAEAGGVKNPVKIVHDGAEALGYLENETDHKTPRLAVLDVKMPC